MQNFKPILKGRRDRVEYVRCRDKKYMGQIVIYVEIMISEGTVLLRIEHLEQSSARITTKIPSKLIDFIKKNYRVDRTRTLHQLHYLSWQRSNICSAMAADLRLIVYTTECETNKFTSGRVRDRFTKRSLTYAGGSNET